MNKHLEYLFSIPKSIYFCFRCLPFKQAVYLPVLVRYNVLLQHLGRVNIRYFGDGNFGIIRIGFGEVGIFDRKFERTIWDVAGSVLFHGKARIVHGSRIVVGNGGVLTLGDNFICTSTMSLICYKSINIGYNTLISWNTLIMDSDFHLVYVKDNTKDVVREREVLIGNNVWIGCRVTILKGTNIGNNCVIAAGSVVNKSFLEDNVLIAGNPASERKRGIGWKM